jgi:hypothetical protein
MTHNIDTVHYFSDWRNGFIIDSMSGLQFLPWGEPYRHIITSGLQFLPWGEPYRHKDTVHYFLHSRNGVLTGWAIGGNKGLTETQPET